MPTVLDPPSQLLFIGPSQTLPGQPVRDGAYSPEAELAALRQELAQLRAKFSSRSTCAADPATVQAKFEGLVQEWKERTRFISAADEMLMDPAYQKIIGMGSPVVPLILQELTQRPDHWFWALQMISGDNPVPANATFDEAVSAWLRWGMQRFA